MAEDVAVGTSPRPAAEATAPNREERTPAFYTRFSLAYMLLIIVAVLGVGALVVILARPDAKKAPPWSTFKPTGEALQIERQIATQVSSEYKASTTEGLVSVFPGPLATTQYIQTGTGQTGVQVPISLIAVRPDVSTGKHVASDYTFFQPGSTVAYEMCGFGDTQQNCGVVTATGNPTALLHREALELALYTLKYLPDVNAVLVNLPPPANPQKPATSVLIARTDVKANLRLPLRRTLEPQEVLLGGGVPNANHVGELTASRIYTFRYQTLPGSGATALVLSPVTG